MDPCNCSVISQFSATFFFPLWACHAHVLTKKTGINHWEDIWAWFRWGGCLNNSPLYFNKTNELQKKERLGPETQDVETGEASNFARQQAAHMSNMAAQACNKHAQEQKKKFWHTVNSHLHIDVTTIAVRFINVTASKSLPYKHDEKKTTYSTLNVTQFYIEIGQFQSYWI